MTAAIKEEPKDLSHLTRQWDVIPHEVLSTPVTIIGAGAIGGWTALSLAKMGMENITVFDFDSVEVENLNAQFYRFKDIGRKKVEALRDLVEEFTGVRLRIFAEKYAGEVPFKGILIAAVDSMKARELIHFAHRDRHDVVLLDPRMAVETAILHIVKPAIDQDYPHSLHTDENSVQERCTAKATIYTANLLSGLVCASVKAVLTGKPHPNVVMWDIAKYQHLAFMPEAKAETKGETK
jgi:hypothetical protein